MSEEPVPAAEAAEDNNQILVAYRRQIQQSFHKLLIPEIFSKILRHLTAKDRLNLRLCSQAIEEAVAKSDMHIEGTPQMISLTDVTNELKLHLGLKKHRTTLGKHFDYGDLEEVARVRDRLFTRVFTKYLEVNVKYVPFSLITRILEGCMFEELDLVIYNEEHLSDAFDYLNSLDSKRCEGTKLSLNNARKNEKRLLGLKRLRALEIRNISAVDDGAHLTEYHSATYISDAVFIELVERRHARISLGNLVAFAQTIDAVKKIIEGNAEPQLVTFEVWDNALERFMLSVGLRMIKDTKGKFTHIIKMRGKAERNLPEAEKREEVKLKMRYGTDNKWNGDFDLDFGHMHVRAKAHHRDYTLQISNYYREKEKLEESSDDERTAYF